jgi:hypothetical protein
MDVQTDERLLINIEGYLIELVSASGQEENYSWFVDRVSGKRERVPHGPGNTLLKKRSESVWLQT